MGRWYRSEADDAERIGAVVLSDDGSDVDCTDDGTECDWYYVEPRECDLECAEDPKPDDYCCTEVTATDSGCHWKGQDEMG